MAPWVDSLSTEKSTFTLNMNVSFLYIVWYTKKAKPQRPSLPPKFQSIIFLTDFTHTYNSSPLPLKLNIHTNFQTFSASSVFTCLGSLPLISILTTSWNETLLNYDLKMFSSLLKMLRATFVSYCSFITIFWG